MEFGSYKKGYEHKWRTILGVETSGRWDREKEGRKYDQITYEKVIM
jgi:hypothetical protein